MENTVMSRLHLLDSTEGFGLKRSQGIIVKKSIITSF